MSPPVLMTPNSVEARAYVANYELNAYKYSDFWKTREYEHKSEVMLLQRLLRKYLPDLDRRTIMDLGGAYGRLTPYYAPQAKQIILADYSTHELLDGKENLHGREYINKVSFLALNAYKMPIKDSSLDALLSVRVMHHFKTPELFFQEVSRVLVPGGIAVLEFANKNHVVAVVKALFSFRLSEFLREPKIEVSHKSDSQGIQAGQVSIMYNFSWKYICTLAESAGLRVKTLVACSFLRVPFLKKIVPIAVLLLFEDIAQRLLAWTRLTPSLFIVLEKPGAFQPDTAWSFEDSFICPTCKSSLVRKSESFVCTHGHTFLQGTQGIVDLRDPRPETIRF